MFAVPLPSETPLEALARRRRELDAAEAEWVAMVSEYDRSGQWYDEGHHSAAGALRAACRMTGRAARSHVLLARKLQHFPELAAAYEAGEIRREHVEVVTRACTWARRPALQKLEPAFVDIAKRADADVLHTAVRYACGQIDGDGGASGDANAFDARRLHLSPSLAGVGYLDGQLDSVGTEVVGAALDAVMDRDRLPDDSRSASQRRADALVAICRSLLDSGELGSSRGARPHMLVVVDLQTLTGASDALLRDVRAEAAHAGHLSAATLDRIACDCDVSRVIMAGRQEVLDVGRATRTISPALWKALVARDGHCTAWGCDKPPGWCEAHHKTPWSQGGETALDNLELLCWHHHQQRHLKHARRRRRAPTRLRAS
jgi:hypothetical protein